MGKSRSSTSGGVDDKVDAVYADYQGKMRFTVRHETLGACKVAAPNYETAIAAAAKHFGKRWQDYSFYAYCQVFKA